MKRTILSICQILAFLCPAGFASGSPVLTASVDRDTIQVGDPVELTLTLRSLLEEQIGFPEFPGETELHFELLDLSPPEEVSLDGVLTRTLRIMITSYETGTWEIPPFSIGDGDSPTDAITIAVISVGIDEGGRPRDVKEPIPPPWSIWRVVLLVLLALLIISAILLLWLRRRGKENVLDPRLAPVDLRPAHVVAYEALDRARADWSGNDDPVEDRRDHSFKLSTIVREYIRNRFALPATERTTREIMGEIRREKLPTDATGTLRELLRRCDLIKYRGDRLVRDEFEDLLREAKDFVTRTRESRGETTTR